MFNEKSVLAELWDDGKGTHSRSRRNSMTKSRHHRTPHHFAVAVAAALGTLVSVGGTAPALSAPLYPASAVNEQINDSSDVVNVAVVVRRGAGVGPRGNAYRYRSTTVVRPGVGAVGRAGAVVVRPGYPGRWARPGWYRWGPGGAIAAGAALGFIAAGAAVAYGTPPAPGMCWYYTDPTRTQGFWDYCPQ
jgi:hypothetical protein